MPILFIVSLFLSQFPDLERGSRPPSCSKAQTQMSVRHLIRPCPLHSKASRKHVFAFFLCPQRSSDKIYTRTQSSYDTLPNYVSFQCLHTHAESCFWSTLLGCLIFLPKHIHGAISHAISSPHQPEPTLHLQSWTSETREVLFPSSYAKGHVWTHHLRY